MGSRDEGQAAGLSAGRARRPHVRPEPIRESFPRVPHRREFGYRASGAATEAENALRSSEPAWARARSRGRPARDGRRTKGGPLYFQR